MKMLLAFFLSLVSGSAFADSTVVLPLPGQQYVVKNSTWSNRSSTVTAAEFVAVSTPGFVGNGAGITNLSTGALPASVTLQGNTFNGASQLVKLDSLAAFSLSGGTLTRSGSGVYSLVTSSAIWVQGGGVKLPDGSVLTSTAGLGGSGGTITVFAQDNFLSQANGVTKNFVLSQTPASSSGVFVFLNGLLQSGTSDWTFTPPQTVAMTTAPASGSTEFTAIYAINSSTLPAVAVLNADQTFTGSNTFLPGPIHGNITTTTQAVRGEITWGSTLLDCKSTVTVSGSTFTIIGNAGQQSSAGAYVAGYLVDGKCPSGHICSLDFAVIRTPWYQGGNNSAAQTVGMNAKETLAPGSHSFCFYMANNSGPSAGSILDFRVEAN